MKMGMDKFKRQYKKEVPYLKIMQKEGLIPNEERKKEELLTKEERENKDLDLIYTFFRRELTEEEKQKLLAIEEEDLTSEISIAILKMLKEYIQTGKLENQTCENIIKQIKPKKVELPGVGEFSKPPEEWGKKEEKDDEQEL